MAVATHTQEIIRAHLAWSQADPFLDNHSLRVIEDGAVVFEGAQIVSVGPFHGICAHYPDALVHDHKGCWLIPGLVDAHLHFPQTLSRAQPGHQLLEWLSGSIFPAELALVDPEHAHHVAELFTRALIRSGTTAAAVFGSQFLQANLSLLQQLEATPIEVFLGPSLMDQNAPDGLITPAQTVWDDAQTLKNAMAKNPRQHFALTPRFALSCSDELVEVCRSLVQADPHLLVQTHINESPAEIDAVSAMFPSARSYFDVYIQQGLVSDRMLLAHSIHTSEQELEAMSRCCVNVVHCPTSNAYLGSGIHPLRQHREAGVRVCLGTDVGAGLYFSLLDELKSAYLLQKLRGDTLTLAHLLDLATRAGASAMGLSDRERGFQAGGVADFVLIDPSHALLPPDDRSPEQNLFSAIMTSGSKLIAQVWAAGKSQWG
ncbi:MAG: guanine deaminase [Acidobacteria bacterium]|nr:guanine deaminase [Acidobacteriota bacterium]